MRIKLSKRSRELVRYTVHFKFHISLLALFEQTLKPRLSWRQKRKAPKVLSTLAPRVSRRVARNERLAIDGGNIYVSE